MLLRAADGGLAIPGRSDQPGRPIDCVAAFVLSVGAVQPARSDRRFCLYGYGAIGSVSLINLVLSVWPVVQTDFAAGSFGSANRFILRQNKTICSMFYPKFNYIGNDISPEFT